MNLLKVGWIALGLVFSLTALGHAGDGIHRMVNCTRVQVSTTPASPVTMLSASNVARRTQLLVNPIGGDGTTPAAADAILIGDAGTTFSASSSTGTVRIRANVWWSPDSFQAPYVGALTAVAISTGPLNVDVCREQ